MDERETPEPQPDDDEEWLVSDQDDLGETEITRGEFKYIGRGLTRGEFLTYLNGGDGQPAYNFGTIPPDFIVLHHTWKPTLGDWTAGEAGMGADAIINKRLRTVARQRDRYRDVLHWSAGPHLFIDDRYIWLFTPMRDIGIHASFGNSHDGIRHYSIGIEVVGNYIETKWSDPVASLVGFAVAALKQRLGTFELQYMYPTPESKPGRKVIRTNSDGSIIWGAKFPDRLRAGGIASHRDFNKPECPGTAITEEYYIKVLKQAWADLTQTPVIDSGEGGTQPGEGAAQPDADAWSVTVVGAHRWKTATPELQVATEALGRLEQGARMAFTTIRRGREIQGNAWWGCSAPDDGFVSLTVVAPQGRFCPRPTNGRYTVVVNGAHIWEAPTTSSPVALGGTARLEQGAQLEFDEFLSGMAINGNRWWGHLANGTGFVSLTTVEPVAE